MLMGCRLRGGRKNAVEAEVHGLGGVVIGPGAVEDQENGGAREGAAAKERNGIGEVGVIDLGEGSGAEIEGLLYCGDEFILGIGFGEFGAFGSGDAGKFGAEEIVGVGDVDR